MKDLARRKMRVIREGIGFEDRKIAEESINLRLIDFLENSEHTVIAGYYPIKSEVSILKTLEKCAFKKTCLPRIDGNNLVFKRWQAGDFVEKNKYCYEPIESCETIIPDLVILPCLAYDLEGHRIGYGAGYYDRALAKLTNATTVLVAFSAQELDKIETDDWDKKVDYVINEVAIKKISP